MILDWSIFKKPEEEKKLDWSVFKPPEEKKETLDWSSLKPPEVMAGVGVGAGIGAKAKIGIMGTNLIPAKISTYTPVKETLWGKIKKPFEAKPETQVAKAQVSYNISQKTGIPITEINQNLDKYSKALGIRGIPTSEEYLSAMFTFPVAAALIANPITTGIGVAKFMALTEAENFVISKVKNTGYKFGAGKGFKELLPEETNQLTKDAVDIIDFLGKGYLIAKTDKNIMKMWNKFTKDLTTEYKLPENMYLSADKIRNLHGTLNTEEYTQFEKDIYANLGNKADIARKAFKEGGVDIEIPASKIETFADKPWFAKLKEAFGVKPFSNTIINYAGEVKPVTGLIEGKVGIPEVSKVEPIVEPTPKTAIPKELEPLAEEARKYESVEEFRNALYPSGGALDVSNRDTQRWGRLILSQIEGEESPTIKDFIREYDFEWKGIFKDIGKNPPDISKGKITVWRAAPKDVKIEAGDWVALTKEYAEVHLGVLGREQLYKQEVNIDDVVWAGTAAEEWFYAPKEVREIVKGFYGHKKINDFYNQAVGLKAEGKAEATIPITEKTAGVGEVKPEKLITPVGTVSGEKGSLFIPSMAEVQNIGTKMAGVVSIEAPFIKSGAKETGFQVKNYYNNIGVAHGQGLDEINKLNKFNFKTPVAIESGFKISKDLDYTDITYISENPTLISKLTPEEKLKVAPADKSIRDFYKKWEDKLKEIGWMEEPFPQSLITRNNRTIGNLKGSLGTTKSPETRTKILDEIKNLTDINERIKNQNIQFVSVPAKLILAKMDTNPELRAKVMSILPHWGRTTITVKDLVDRGIITRKEADIRYIIGEYSDRMGRKYALGQIFENAEKEGLIKSSVEKPDWPTARIVMNGQRVSIPQLRGKRLDPFFSDVIAKFFGRGQVGLGGIAENTLGIVKMMQFYNPLFMPMYDVWQSAAAGAIINIKAPKYIIQGFNDSFKKTDNYYTAMENGTFSKPFIIPYDKFEYQFTEAMKGNKLGVLAKKVALPTNWIPLIYQGSWNIAWKLDETIRMVTFNYLKDKGYTDREAGQQTALYQSDYASVPPATRKVLNKIFFTPTFKMTMAKLYLNMLKGTVKCGLKIPAKIVGVDIKVSKQEKNLARGAAIGLGIMMGIKLYFQNKGYKEEELFRKYVKTVETDEGPKENVITLANPFNIPWRYYYRVKNAFKPQTTNVAEKLVETVKWDLHPIWRVSSDVVQNYRNTVYNGYDDSETIALDVGKYVIGKLIAITGSILESSETGNVSLENFKALQNDLGKLEAYIIKPFIFNYLREPKNIRKGWALRKLQNDFRNQALDDPPENPKEAYIRLQNYNKRLKEILTDFQ